MRKVAIMASASGTGKSTLGRQLARQLGVPFVELDALVYGPNWQQTPAAELRARVRPLVAQDGWVIDGAFWDKLGPLVLDAADTVVWLDFPMLAWLPRLLARQLRRQLRKEILWNGNRETWGGAAFVLAQAFVSHIHRRLNWPRELRVYPVVRLTSPRVVARWLKEVGLACHPGADGAQPMGDPAGIAQP